MAWLLGSMQRRLADAMKGGGDSGLAQRVASLEKNAGEFRGWLSTPASHVADENESISLGVTIAGISVAAGTTTQNTMRSHASSINQILACLRAKGLMKDA